MVWAAQCIYDETTARKFIAATFWLLLILSAVFTVLTYFTANPLLRLLGANGEILSYGERYIKIIAFGTVLQIIATGLVPLIRNLGGSIYAMFAMIAGFVTNIVLDYLFVFVANLSVEGAAWATVIGQGVTMIMGLAYLLYKKQFTLKVPFKEIGKKFLLIVKIGIAPFGLTMSPNFSTIIINRFSVSYGGDMAVAVYACIAYIICIAYLILQGVGDGSQPLMSKFYGEKDGKQLKSTQIYAYITAMAISAIACALMFGLRFYIGKLFGASEAVNTETGKILPIFLLSIPFVAISYITNATFYATEKSILSYIVTYIEPVLMLIFMFILPRYCGGQIMIWWCVVIVKILTAVVAVMLKIFTERKKRLRIAENDNLQ